MSFKIVRNDITKMNVDVIVNTANHAPVYYDGTDTAVYKAAGEEKLLAERKKIGYLEEGEVAITPGFELPARYIIHAVSPCYKKGTLEEEEKLRSCYKKSLELALEYQCKSIAFPLIATGSFGYPKEEGMRIAVDEINGFLLQHEMVIYLVVFDAEATRLGKNLHPDLETYIDSHYVSAKIEEEYTEWTLRAKNISREMPMPATASSVNSLCAILGAEEETEVVEEQRDETDFGEECQDETDAYEEYLEKTDAALQERMQHMSDTFQQYLLYLIESKGLSNAEVYKRAIVTKQVFSKIKLNPDYHPDKATAMRLCVGAKLNLDETTDLLARAGYALSPCNRRDIIFSYFIEKNIYDMIEIDIVLEEYGLPCFIE